MRVFCENEGIKYIKSSPYHPQTNGAVEFINKAEQEYLQKRKNIMNDNFDIAIELDNIINGVILFNYNNKIHSIAGYSLNNIKDTDEFSFYR